MTPVRRLAIALTGLAVVTALGTLGFVWIEGWPWFDALYMTVTTITTVGYREVGPLSTGGRAFVIALIAMGVGTTLYLLTALAALVLEGQLRAAWLRNAMQRRIDALGSHVVVCGYGRYGRVVVDELVHARVDLVVVEVDPALDSELAQAGVPYLIGSAVHDEVLERAGIRRARALVIATSSESENVFITLSARELAPEILIHARGESEAALRRLRRAGANRVTSPYRMGGLRTAASILRPSVVDFLELSQPRRGEAIDLEEILVAPGSPLCGRDVASLEAATPRLLVVAIKRGEEPIRVAPDKATRLVDGDTLVVIGERPHLDQLARRAEARAGA
jgi:voltage-gated potassium channel